MADALLIGIIVILLAALRREHRRVRELRRIVKKQNRFLN